MFSGTLVLKRPEFFIKDTYPDVRYTGPMRFNLLGYDDTSSVRFSISAADGQESAELLQMLTADSKDYCLGYGMYSLAPNHAFKLFVQKANKYKTDIPNIEFCSKVSAFLRFCLTAKHRETLDFSDIQSFRVQDPLTGQVMGSFTRTMGSITQFRAESEFLSLEFSEVAYDSVQFGFLQERKNDKKMRIRAFHLGDAELGFKYVPPVALEAPTAAGFYSSMEEVIQAHPDKEFRWIAEADYHIVSDDNLQEVIDMFMEHDGPVAFDTETSGLKITFKSRDGDSDADQLVGCVLSRRAGEGYYFPLQHKMIANLCGGDHFYFMERYMKPILEGKPIICHNTQFDWKVAYIYDINTNVVFDTMLAFGVTKRYENANFSIALKSLAKDIFGRDSLELSDLVYGGKFGDDVRFWDLPYELVRSYAPADTDNTFALFDYIRETKLLQRYNAVEVFKIEVTFSKVLAYAEFYGLHLDADNLPTLVNSLQDGITTYRDKIYQAVGHEFNIDSSSQLSKVLYDEMQVEQLTNGGESNRSTKAEVLKTLSKRKGPDGEAKYPVVSDILKYREYSTLNKNFANKIDDYVTKDGYVFAHVRQLGTDTGRVSVSDPNYQSYNDVVKHYVTPRKGFLLFDCDFAQIEQRVLVSYASIMFPEGPELSLMKDFDDPDMDYHQYQAARMFNVPYSAVTKAMRSESKGINFGLPYGMGDESLGARIYGERCAENTRKAAALRAKFFQGQELIARFFETVRANGVREGYTSTQWGRRRYYDRANFTVSQIRRQAGNHVIQGTAADIYKLAVNNLFNMICEKGWLGKVLLLAFIHDEVLIEVHESINPYEFFTLWRENFEVRPEGYCKLFAGAGFGNCWYDAKKQDLPPGYIDEVIDLYHPDMEWDGDQVRFLKELQDGFARYKTNRVKTYLMDESKYGEVIKPAVGALLADEVALILKDLATYPPEKLSAFVQSVPNLAGVLKLDSLPDSNFKNLQHQMELFCAYHGLPFEKVNILSVDDVKQPTGATGTIDLGLTVDMSEVDTVDVVALCAIGLQLNGFFVDEEARTLHLAEAWGMTSTGKLTPASEFFLGNGNLTQVPAGDRSLGSQLYRVFYHSAYDAPGVEIPTYGVTRENLVVIQYAYMQWLPAGLYKVFSTEQLTPPGGTV